MQKSGRVFKKNNNIVARKIGNELILVPVFKSDKDINEIYTLNDMAGRIWELIDGKRTLGKIRDNLLNKFDIEDEILDKYLDEFFVDLTKIKAVL